MRRRSLFAAVLLLLQSCTVFVPAAWHRATQNQRNVNRIHLGQTLTEVERVMGSGPERRSTRLRFDGLSVEEWSYLTDYLRHSDTTITFVGEKVEEIRVSRHQCRPKVRPTPEESQR